MRLALVAKVVLIAVLLLAAFGIQTAEPQKSMTDTSFSDDFDSSTLGSEWRVVDDAGDSTFDSSANPGWLRITTTAPPSRDLRMGREISNTLARIMMLWGVQADFAAETKIVDPSNTCDQVAGILVWLANTQFMSPRRTYRRQVRTLVFFSHLLFGLC